VKPPVRVLVPPGVVTLTFLGPRVAAMPIVMLAFICVDLLAVKLFTVIPEPKDTAVVPVKLLPLIVTVSVCPRAPRLGLTEDIVGGPRVTVKPPIRVPVPAGVVTLIFLGPRPALEVMLMLAVIWLPLFTVKLFTVMPEPKDTAVAPVKLLPFMVTVSFCP
jgi:hypothetical protein